MRYFSAVIAFAIFTVNLSMLRILRKCPSAARNFRALSQPLTKTFQFDYLLESNRVTRVFEDTDSITSDTVAIDLVSKSMFDSWKSKSESHLSFQLFKRMTGTELKSFPGSKVITCEFNVLLLAIFIFTSERMMMSINQSFFTDTFDTTQRQ